MSDEQDHFYFSPFNENQYATQGFEPSSLYMGFTECLQGSSFEYSALDRAFGLLSEKLLLAKDEGKPVEGGDIPFTPNCISVISTSSEAGDEGSDKGKKDISQKNSDDGEDSSKKVNKSKNRGEKKKREPRFAFMTKSEVDHLEDGYRWRKYGQKAVKNSPFPRDFYAETHAETLTVAVDPIVGVPLLQNYYRCTTQKCLVKKRVERSFENPSIVITTYEGQHNHPLPATIRGHVTGLMSASMLAPPPRTSTYSYHHGGIINTTLTPFQQLNEYGLLQDIVPSSMFLRKEP